MSTGRRKNVGHGTQSVSKVKKRPRNRRRPNYLLLFTIFLLSIGLSTAVSYALQTPKLVVKQVTIKGVRLADQAVVEKLGKQVLGKNILLLKKSSITSAIAGLSEVREVKMGRKFPNKVWIRVWERKPDAVITDGSKYCMAQSDGLMFHTVKGPVDGVPLLQIAGLSPIRESCEAGKGGAQYALQTLKYARTEKLKVRKISVDPVGDICLNIGSDFYVNLGQPDEIDKKLARVRTALVYRPSLVTEAAYIDVSCPKATVWKPRVAALFH